MPKFFKQNLLFKQQEEENAFLPNPLDTPELPKDEEQAEAWQNQILPQPAMEVYHAEDPADFPQPENPQFQDVFEPELSQSDSTYESQSDPLPVEHLETDTSSNEEPDHSHHQESHKEPELPHHEHSEPLPDHPSHQAHREYDPDIDEPDPVKTLLTWTAPSRPFRKKG